MSEPPVHEEPVEPEPVTETSTVAAAQPARRGDRGPRSALLIPLLTATVGLMLGVLIGAAGVGLFAVIALHHHRHHGPVPGDGRGHHWPDNRPPGRQLPPWR